jgi:hypothetical protein
MAPLFSQWLPGFFRKLICYALLLVCFSCNKTDQVITVKEGHLVSVLRTQEFGIQEMIGLTLQDFPELDFSMLESVTDLFNLELKVSVTAISYNTTDPGGNPVIASGIIVQPVGIPSRGVIHVPPTTPLSCLEGGSDLLIITEGVFAFMGFTVIIPDLIGSGVSKHLPQPFLFMDHSGQVCYDMQLAAMEYCNRYSPKPLPAEIDVFGYSGGATCAVALLRHIDRLPHSPIRVKRLFAGGGLYNMHQTYSELKDRGYAEYPLIPLLIASMDYWYNLNLDYSRVFTGNLLINRETWLDRTRNAEQMRALIDPQLHTYMHPDFFTAGKNAEIQKIENVLSLHSMAEGWHTKTRLYLGHATDDLSVPFSATQELYNNLKTRTNVTLITGNGGHYNYGIEFFIAACLYLTAN